MHVVVKEASVIIYLSKTTTPSSAMYDEIMEGRCGNAYPREEGYDGGRRKRQSPDIEETIYIAIEGVGENNEYELNATTGDTSTPKGKHVSDKLICIPYQNNFALRYGIYGLYSTSVPQHILLCVYNSSI